MEIEDCLKRNTDVLGVITGISNRSKRAPGIAGGGQSVSPLPAFDGDGDAYR